MNGSISEHIGEGVQKHVMLQVTEVREATKRAEAVSGKLQQKNDELLAEVQQLRTTSVSQSQQTDRAQAEVEKAHAEAVRLRTERESLIQQTALLTGKLEAQTTQIDAFERRATNAEIRLEEALKRSGPSKRRLENRS